MDSIASLITKLEVNHPELIFAPANEFRWSPDEKTIFYIPHSLDLSSLLHEVAHAILGHTSYRKDIELIRIEDEAWEYAKSYLEPIYGVIIDGYTRDGALDTYRDWLHKRSVCPACSATGVEIHKHIYQCLVCTTTWRVNDARMCDLRRHVLK